MFIKIKNVFKVFMNFVGWGRVELAVYSNGVFYKGRFFLGWKNSGRLR